MRWRGRRQSSNVEDRRGRAAPGSYRGGRVRGVRLPMGRGAGGTSLLTLVIIGGVLWIMGVSPTTILSMLVGGGSVGSPSSTQYETATGSGGSANDEMANFVTVVLAETEDVWGQVFANAGQDYPEPKLVLFSRQVSSACGYASSATGPFYCPGDQKVYIDLAFYRELRTRFEAPGDFAQAYVVAHEVGHHIQNVTGILPKFNEMRRSMSELEANRMSIRVELQADCYAESGRITPIRRDCWSVAISMRHSMPRPRSATMRCSAGHRAMLFPTVSITVPLPSARSGFPLGMIAVGLKRVTPSRWLNRKLTADFARSGTNPPFSALPPQQGKGETHGQQHADRSSLDQG